MVKFWQDQQNVLTQKQLVISLKKENVLGLNKKIIANQKNVVSNSFKKEKLLEQNVNTLEKVVKLLHQDSVKKDNIKTDVNIKDVAKF